VIAALERFDAYAELLGRTGSRLPAALTIVRGLAYYKGIVFELFDKGEFRAVCGGGRYDNLLSALGGVDMPALGFGMGDVVLGELLKARGKMPSGSPAIDYWVAPVDAAHRLRWPGGRACAGLGERGVPLKDQAFKQPKAPNAGARGGHRVIAIASAKWSSRTSGAASRPCARAWLIDHARTRFTGANDRP
jgi:histidyl-tRNA synthetase